VTIFIAYLQHTSGTAEGMWVLITGLTGSKLIWQRAQISNASLRAADSASARSGFSCAQTVRPNRQWRRQDFVSGGGHRFGVVKRPKIINVCRTMTR